jgi:hypothetical protein
MPADSIVRAILICPECIEAKRIIIPDEPRQTNRETV